MISRKAIYLQSSRGPVFCYLHIPQQITAAMVICPPIGHEFINSYRSLRHLADSLAESGKLVVRLNYQGIGDSSGLDSDADRMESWLESIGIAMDYLQQQWSVSRIELLGLRVGASLAFKTALKRNVHALYLWAPIIKGKRYVREILALQKTGENADFVEADSKVLEGGGYLLSEQTMADLSNLDIDEHQLPNAAQVFWLDRDDLPAASGVRDAWQQQGKLLTHRTLAGYADMMATPHHTQVPFAAIEEIVSLNKSSELDASARQVSPAQLAALQQCEFDYIAYDNSSTTNTTVITEQVCEIGDLPLFAIYCYSKQHYDERLPVVVLLNGGSVHRVGPNRNYIFISRLLAQMGYAVLRADFVGLGDSITADTTAENNPYMPQANENVSAYLQFLQRQKNARSFVLAGLCSGAYSSFQYGLQDHGFDIKDIVLINPLTFYWRQGMSLDVSPVTHVRQWDNYKKSMWKADRWLALLSGKKSIANLLSTMRGRLISFVRNKLLPVIIPGGGTENLGNDLMRISKRGIRVHCYFSDSDPGYKIMKEKSGKVLGKLQRQGKLTISFINNANHTLATHSARLQLLQYLFRDFKN